MLSSPPSLSPNPLFCREKEDLEAFLPHLQRARSPACSKLQRLPSVQRFSLYIVPMGWEEPELQDQPVCKQLCLFCSGVSGSLWAQFPSCPCTVNWSHWPPVLKGLIFLTLTSFLTVLAQLKAHPVPCSAPAPTPPYHAVKRWLGNSLPSCFEAL